MNEKFRILLTGGSGMLGEAFIRLLPDSWTFINLGRSPSKHTRITDIRNSEQIHKHITSFQPNCIVHAAAITNLEYCEVHKDEAYEINVAVTKSLMNLAKDANIPFVFISTAGVFDGKKEWYVETDKAHPITMYGKTKYEAEKIVSLYDKSLIVRSGWLVGGGREKDKKFVGIILNKMFSKEKHISIVDDTFGTITSTDDLINSLFALLIEKKSGIFHCAVEERMSRYDIAYLIGKLVKYKGEIHPVPSSFFTSKYHVRRQVNESLISAKLDKSGCSKVRSIHDILRVYSKVW